MTLRGTCIIALLIVCFVCAGARTVADVAVSGSGPDESASISRTAIAASSSISAHTLWLLAQEIPHGSTDVSYALRGPTQESAPSADGAQLQPTSLRAVAMFAAVAFTLLLAAGGGMGGGAIFVPLYILVGGFSTSQAVALSNITVLGGALANLSCNLYRRHPTLPLPLINWDLIMVMEPTTILGALLGTYMNKLLPVWVTSFLLASLLTLLTVKLLKRAVRTAAAESVARAQLVQYSQPLLQQQQEEQQAAEGAALAAAAAAPAPAGLEQPDCAAAAADTDPPAPMAAIYISSPSHAALQGSLKASQTAFHHHEEPAHDFCSDSQWRQLQEQERREERQVPRGPILTMLLLAVAVVATDTFKSWLPCGSWRYWLLVLSMVPLCVTVMVLVRRHLLLKAALRQRAGASSRADGDLQWDGKNTIIYPCICSTAGVVAGLFGVGGGIVKGPLMLELGVCPQVAAATSATMITFTAGAACVVYLNFGGIDAAFAVLLVTLGFLATLVGQWVTSSLVRALGRKSIIVFAMGLLLLLSTLAGFYQAAVNWRWVLQHRDQMWQGGSICGNTAAHTR